MQEHPTTPEKCPRCGHLSLFTIPFFSDLWACPNCERGKAEELSDSENHTRRTELRRQSIAIRMRVEKVKMIADDPHADVDERADSLELLWLYERLKLYLEEHQNLPFIMEKVRQLKGLDPRAVPPPDSAELIRLQSVTAQQEEAELKLRSAERGIRDFHRNLPLWHETYTMTNARIKATAAKSAPITAAVAAPHAPPAPASAIKSKGKKVWKGDERQLAGKLADEWEGLPQKRKELTTQAQYVKQKGQDYEIEKPSGIRKKINPESLWRNYRQKFP